ncbi:L-lactate permease [Brevibacillus ruminantium]|uniref:L-lactate permease n=1 Tax=Brevibacillus ruminantium TaxID=2950604 RepID=A0ABY4WGQ7_9BACL|nr:L-lactate permease [Brevibacillus ruminantium]USG64519.1 L-lactate permease [Brevibacillus ruminantium]
MKIFLACFPILLILLLLFVGRLSAWKAGLIGVFVTVALALFVPDFATPSSSLYAAAVKGALTTSLVAYVILFGILLYHLMNESGVIQTIASFIAYSAQDPIRQVLLLAVGFSPLVESSSGFGIAVIVLAPILISLGFDRFRAVLISLVSLSAVPWGSLAMGTIIGANLGNVPVGKLGAGSALLSLPTFVYFALLIVYLAGGWSGVKRRFWETLLISGVFGLSVWAANRYVSVELAGVFGSLTAIGTELLCIRFAAGRTGLGKRAAEAELSVAKEIVPEGEQRCSVVKTFSPYLILITLLLLSRLITPVEAFLQSHLVLSLPAYGFSLPLLYSPGFFLGVTCLLTCFLFSLEKDKIIKSLRSTLVQATPVIGSTLFYVVLSELMSAAAMTETLAHAAAALFGSAFLFFSPVIGGMGGFLTGSNTGSNAMFIKLQTQTATQLGISPELVAYGQNTASSHAMMASPSRVLLGASVGDVKDREQELLKKISLIVLGMICLVVLGLVRIQLFS